MKKILVLLTSFFAFGLSVLAQDGAVKVGKGITGPDNNGVYTINLEAYVTGSVTVTEETLPADIVLVLDYSGSMNGNPIRNLRTAVARFVRTIQSKNDNVKTDANGGHRIALVLYDADVYTNSSYLNTLIDVDDFTVGTNTVRIGGASGTDLIGYNTGSGTDSRDGMNRANKILSDAYDAGDYTDSVVDGVTKENSKRSRVVVMFTDGEPYAREPDGTRYSMEESMAMCIVASNTIKNSTTYGAKVYTVGLFNGHSSADQVTTYMSYTSSDYSDKTEANRPYVNVSGKYSIIVQNASDLENVFSSIAEATGGDYSASSASSVLVDVVTASFLIPTDTDLGEVKVYKVPCTKSSADAILTFDTNRSHWEDITDDVSLVTNPSTGRVEVSNYNYGLEWCGYDASATDDEGNIVGGPHGHKLVLEIPIMANENAVGGPNVDTNADESKLTIKDEKGTVIGEYEFPHPVISLPVNIHIMKAGLKEGESAKFTIFRTTLPVTSSSTWDYVSSVFVTNGDSCEFEDYENEDETTSSYPVAYVRGLPSARKATVDGETITYEYVYKIVEEDWSWSYQFSQATGNGPSGTVTVTNKNEVTSDKFITNPIVFWNNPETNVDKKVRHAESKATNVFLGSGTVIFDDSKDNGR